MAAMTEPHCWGCLVPMKLPAQPGPQRPFWHNICAGCWQQLPLTYRLEFSARFTSFEQGGLGEQETREEFVKAIELLRPLQGDLRLVLDALREAAERERGNEL
jgi:hypothetical protein